MQQLIFFYHPYKYGCRIRWYGDCYVKWQGRNQRLSHRRKRFEQKPDVQKRPLKMKKLTIVVTACLLTLAAQTSKANSITYSLDESDQNNTLSSGNWGSVTVSMTSDTTASVTFTAGIGFSLVDSGIADLNANPGATVSDLAAGFSSTGGGNVDGLGSFTVTTKYQNASSPFNTVTYTITDTGAAWGANNAASVLISNGSFLAAAHIYDGSKTFFVGADGQTGSPAPVVPDGGTTIIMLGSAMAGLGIIGRRIRKS